MKLAFSSNAFVNFPIEEAIARIADAGYRGIELMADVPHAWPSGLLPQQKRAIREALDRRGLEISNVNAFMMNAVADPRHPYWHPGWIDPDPHYRAIRREHTKRALQLAHELGAPSISTAPGGQFAPEQTWEAASRIFYAELAPCIELAEKLQVRLLLEPEPGLMIETFGQYLQFVQRIQSPWLRLNFDIGHAYCVEEDPEIWVEKMAPHTAHYHFEDIAATRVHEHLIPGRGAIDFAGTLSEIRETGYNGWLTVELYTYIDDPAAAARDARTHLTQVASGIGIDLG